MKRVSKLILMAVLLCWSILPMYGLSSSKHFYAEKTTLTPTGAGQIYVQRGQVTSTSNNDIFNPPTSGWKSSDERFDAGQIDVDSNNPPDGFKVYNGDDDSNTVGVLYIYFYAKPNPGFQFDGWYKEAAATTKLTGSTDVYSTAKTPKSKNTRTPTRWNNGTPGSEPPAVGEWDGIHYMRHVEEVKNGQNDNITRYAKFSIIPRHFKFVGTGFNDVSYTAAGTNVGETTVESGNITSNIALNITYDENKYNFVKWQWSVGFNGVKTDIATSASATYTFVADRGYPTVDYTTSPYTYDDNYQRVHIWPILTEKLDAEATVQIGEADPVPYEHWADAFSAAKAENVSGAIITLKKNITGITTVQAVDRNMTLNLNGFTITGSVNNMFTVSGSGTNFTLCDNTPAQAGRIVHNPADPSATTYALSVASGARLTLTSGGVTAIGVNNVENSAGSSRGVEIKSGATLVMSGGQISSQSTNNAYALVNAGTATISDGVCTAYAKGASSAKTGLTARAFYNTGASVTIDGGIFTASADSSTTVCGIQHNNAATMTVNYAEMNVTVGKGNGAYDFYRSAGKIMVYDGKYKGKYPTSVANKAQIEVQGGIYDSYLNLRACASTGYDCYELEQGADYNEGYRFVVKGLDGSPNVCKVITMSGTTYYSSLVDAFNYVQAHPNDMQAIVMTAFEYDFNVPDNYTVPQQTAFVVPYGAGQTGAQTEPVDIQTWTNLSQYHSLALGPGVNITVQGTFTVGGQQFGTSSSNPGPGSVVGSYAMLDMSAGGHLTIANGASLYAYGFIKGAGDQSTSGTITIQNGGTVYEDLVVNDMHGGGGTAACVNGTSGSNSYGLFPFSQYFIQNIEPRMTIEYGGVEKASYNIQSSQGGKKDMINVIGTGSDFLFQTSSGSTITKWYDATRDYQCYEVSGSMSMNGLTIDAGMASMSSSSFILPLNNNMDIHVKSGAVLNLPYALKLQAGAKLTIDEGAVVNVNNEMYVYDYQDWDKYAISYAQTFGTTTSGKKLDWHTLRDVSSAAKLGNANIVINGQLRIKDSGALYTTSHGANITSTGSGKIIFDVAGKSANKNLYECWSTYGKKSDGTALAQGETDKADGQVQVGSFNLLKTWYIFGTPVECNPAKLKNADGSFTSTSGAAKNDLYQYCDGTWKKGGCVNYYTVTWKSEDGKTTLETNADVAEGSTTSFDKADPTKDQTDQYTYTFDGWTTAANGGGDFYAKGATPAATADATYYAHFTSTTRSYTITWLNDDDSQIDQTTVAYGVVPTHADATKTNTAEWTHTFTGWDTEPVAVTGDATYKATFSSTKNKYTITWWDAQETLPEHLIATEEYEYGVTPSYTYNKPDFGGYTYEVIGWTPTIEAVTGDKTYTAVYNAKVAHKQVSTPEDLKENVQANMTTVYSTGRLNVTSEGSLTTTDFILEATPTASGELKGDITADNVYFDFTPDGDAGTHNRKWYAVAVPWEVDAETGIFNKDNMTAHLGLGTRFDILFYDGALRQQQHASTSACWKFLEYETDKTMHPGRLYMVHFVDNFKTIRFKKKDGSSIHNETIDLLVKNGDDDDMNANWNGIANPATFATTVSVTGGITKGAVYGGGLIGADGWMTGDLDNPLIVGQPIMVQVKKDASAMIATPSPSPLRRSAQEETEASYEYKVEISSNGNLCDRIYVNINDDKENHYVIGDDMAKAGVVTSRAQMWIDRYDTKLSVNTIAPINSQADFPLSVYAPEESEYVIEAVKMPEEGSCLYLTFDGRPIWNLNYSAYTAQLEKGTTNRYGLRIAKKSPMVSTGIEDLTIENGAAIRKVVVEDKVYIIRNGEVYTITGQLVK